MHKINLNCGGLYIDSPYWITESIEKNNKEENKCFAYAVTVTLNHEEIKKSAKNNKI